MRYSKPVKIVSVSLLLAILGYFGLHFWLTRGWQAACGTYLVGGGETYVTITGKAGWLKAEGNINIFFLEEASGRSRFDVTHAVSFRRGHLIIKQNLFIYDDAANGSFVTDMRLSPSAGVPGDWDVQEVSINTSAAINFFTQCRAFTDTFNRWDDFLKGYKWATAWKELWHSDIGEQFNHSITYGRPSPLQRGFLHRVDDGDIPMYFEKRFKNERGPDVLEMARSMQQRHPQDAYLALHRAELEAWHGNVKGAEEMWALWKSQRDILQDPFLAMTSRRVWTTLYMARLSEQHPDFLFAMRGYLNGKETPCSLVSANPASPVAVTSGTFLGNVDDKKEWLTALGKMNSILFCSLPLVPTLKTDSQQKCALNEEKLNSLFDEMASGCYLDFFTGHLESDISLFKGIYALSYPLMIADYGTNYSGINIQTNLFPIFEFYLWNVCQTQEDVAAFRRFFVATDVQLRQYQEDLSTFFKESTSVCSTPFLDVLGLRKIWLGPGDPYANVRNEFQITSARYVLLRLAAVAREQLLTTGEFPKTSADFAPFLEGGMPVDPLCTTRTLQCKPTTDSLLLYSVGPDGKDDAGALVYDATNGTMSSGDVVLSVPRKSPYPYQKNGVRAANAADLLRQYPNGLPPNLAMETRDTPLGILDSTTTQPLRVFTFYKQQLQDWEKSTEPSADPAIVPPPTASEYRKKQKVLIWSPKADSRLNAPWDSAPTSSTKPMIKIMPHEYVEIPKP